MEEDDSATDPAPLVQAPLIQARIFASWEDFNLYFDEYQRQTFQVYVSKTSTSIATRNQKMLHQYGEISKIRDRLMPSELKYYSKTLICTHGGKPRTSTGKGIRPNQTRRARECPAKLNVVVKRKAEKCDISKPSGWAIVVTQQRALHNHPLNSDTFMFHPRNRKVENPMVLEVVSELRKAGVKQGAIRKYISDKEPDKKVTRKDVGNLLAKLKSNNFVVRPVSTTLNPVTQVAGSVLEVNDNVEKTGRVHNEQVREQVSTTYRGEHNSIFDQAMESIDILDDLDEDLGPGLSRSIREEHQYMQHNSSNGTRLHEMAAGSFRLRTSRDTCDSTQDVASTVNGSSSLPNNSDMASEKALVNHLEAQNMALDEQNTRLMEQNQKYVADLEEVRNRAAKQDVILIGLQKAMTTLTRLTTEQAVEIASLKAKIDRTGSGQC